MKHKIVNTTSLMKHANSSFFTNHWASSSYSASQFALQQWLCEKKSSDLFQLNLQFMYLIESRCSNWFRECDSIYNIYKNVFVSVSGECMYRFIINTTNKQLQWFTYCHVYEWLQTVFGLVTQFINPLEVVLKQP
jgi:hypothetical protein